MAGTETPFSCTCQTIKGVLHNAPQRGIHLVCYCASCRAGALHAGDAPDTGEPVDLYLTQPENITISQGLDQLKPYAFSPKGIVRWQADCCGGQLFSSQHNPKTAFMSVRTDKLSSPKSIGPVVTKAFVPMGNGKTQIEGKAGLAKLIFASIKARLSGSWRETPLYDPTSGKTVVPVTLISPAEKKALLAQP